MDKVAMKVQLDKGKSSLVAAMGREKNVEGRLRVFVTGVLANSKQIADEIHEEQLAVIQHLEDDLDNIIAGIIHGHK